jgi:hypothetical protein
MASVSDTMPHRISEGLRRNVWILADTNHVCSGVIVAQDKVLTAAHCKGVVMKVDGRVALIERESPDDLLLLHVPTPIVATDIAFNTSPRQAEEVYTVVNHVPWRSLVSVGRVIGMDGNWVFTSTITAPGISGSGLYDMGGRLVGMSTLMHGADLPNGKSVVIFNVAVSAQRVSQFLRNR